MTQVLLPLLPGYPGGQVKWTETWFKGPNDTFLARVSMTNIPSTIVHPTIRIRNSCISVEKY